MALELVAAVAALEQPQRVLAKLVAEQRQAVAADGQLISQGREVRHV